MIRNYKLNKDSFIKSKNDSALYFSSFLSVTIGSGLLCLIDHAVFKSLDYFGKNLAMIPVIALMNMAIFLELFIFISIIFKVYFSRKDHYKLELFVNDNQNKSIFILFFTFVAFSAMMLVFSYTQLNSIVSLFCAFFASTIFFSIYYISQQYKLNYYERPPILLAIKEEIGFHTLLCMFELSMAVSLSERFPPKHPGLSVILTLVGFFIALIMGSKIESYFNKRDQEYYINRKS